MGAARVGSATRCQYITITAVSFTHCEREARYIDAKGRLCCALCPLIHGVDSIRLADVPALLAKVRDFIEAMDGGGLATAGPHTWSASFREIAGKGTGR